VPVTDARHPAETPLPGFREVKPMVFAGLYPTQAEEYGGVREALEKLNLNDSALRYEPETSKALGYGFRCGFLGLLHMEIVQERLEREYGLQLISTAPTVKYEAHRKDGTVVELETPQQLPPVLELDHIEEPFIEATVIGREDSVGGVLQLLEDRRGEQKKFEYLSPGTVLLVYEMPLSEMIMDLHDKLKTVSRGYASLDYHLIGTRAADLVRLDILVNGQLVDALSLIVPRERAFRRGKVLVEKMKKIIPRQLFEVALQAAIGSRIVARETVPALRKNVIAKCYGGDITRKRKLLEKQREGKRRMKRIGRVDIPQEAFLALIKS
jgi:GTP-binding protein LepA